MQIRSLFIGFTSTVITSLTVLSPMMARSIDAVAQSEHRFYPKLAQTDDRERERLLEQQREAERALKEGERLRREIRDDGFRDGNLERRTNEQIIKIRESGTDPQRVREAQAEIQRIREDNNRHRFYQYYPYYGDFRYPYIIVPIVPYDWRTNESAQTPSFIERHRSTPNSAKFSISAGTKDGLINPALGVRWKNFGVEVGAIFNQDTLPGILNDFSLPSNFLFNDLGIKKTSAQYGADVLGYIDINPTIAAYGGVGIYFQSKSQIAQSQATNELYKQTDETEVTPAVSVGVDYTVSDAVNLGVGYHSLRGITGRIGISF
jgi:opacity protein-like surface antigen